MKDIKYQVFISSTYSDLVEERRKVLDVLLMADCIPAGMEAFVATDSEQFEVIKRVIDYCDYYVLIIGKRYGSVSDETGKSYTEMEYDYALSKNIPVLVFAIDDSVELSDEKIEHDKDKIEKLRRFREKAMNNRLATIWKSSEELVGHLAVSIMKAKTEIIRPGWQRAENYDEASLRREIMELQSENETLQNELKNKQDIIDSYSQFSDLAFDDCSITINYHYYVSGYNGRNHTQKRVDNELTVSLVEIFRVISLQMLNVSVTEAVIEKSITSNLIDTKSSVYLSDNQIIKIILNQLTELGLIQSHWNDKNDMLFWNLTNKGKRTRDKLTLIRINRDDNESVQSNK